MATQTQPARRTDVLALWGGILFSFLFTGVIWLAGQRLQTVPHWPDTGASWYYWRLVDTTTIARATAWGFYLLNQIAAWALIYYAQTRVKKFAPGLQKINVIALAGTAFFILLHFAQTHLFYGGLAEDVSIWSSQVSVIIMLVLILLMENPRRGLFWGVKAPLGRDIVGFVRRNHGYIFAWATIYTFWYHPMENTSGHLIGFLYMFFLMLQGALLYTRVHTNRVWTVTLEVMVAVHGTLVAVMQGNGMWPMFFFGFAGIFVITQMHGLGLPKWAKWLILGVFIALTVVVYNGQWVRLNEIIRIPLIEYLAVFLFAGLIGGGLWIARRVGGQGSKGAGERGTLSPAP
ncbi:MAG: hypothetical protein NT169_16525 [Chloroflexi bacterium]|nr:hypothetical protein [Chloroflexota bacterium]